MSRVLRTAWLTAVALLAGCASPWPARDAAAPSPTPAIVRGDWDDLEAALRTAASQTQCAVVDSGMSDDQPFSMKLASIHDDSMLALASRTDTGEVVLVVSPVGPSSNVAVSDALLVAWATRVGQLAGVATAPLDAPVRSTPRRGYPTPATK